MTSSALPVASNSTQVSFDEWSPNAQTNVTDFESAQSCIGPHGSGQLYQMISGQAYTLALDQSLDHSRPGNLTVRGAISANSISQLQTNPPTVLLDRPARHDFQIDPHEPAPCATFDLTIDLGGPHSMQNIELTFATADYDYTITVSQATLALFDDNSASNQGSSTPNASIAKESNTQSGTTTSSPQTTQLLVLAIIVPVITVLFATIAILLCWWLRRRRRQRTIRAETPAKLSDTHTMTSTSSFIIGHGSDAWSSRAPTESDWRSMAAVGSMSDDEMERAMRDVYATMRRTGLLDRILEAEARAAVPEGESDRLPSYSSREGVQRESLRSSKSYGLSV